jgi:hypothetical protein
VFLLYSLRIVFCTDSSIQSYTDVVKDDFRMLSVSHPIGGGVRISKHLALALGSPSLGYPAQSASSV